MKIVVGVKHVPDTETKIKPAQDGNSVDETGIKWIMSPFDEYAVEQALLLREAREGEVILVCAGREASQSTLRQGLAMGADRAVLLADARYERCDGLARADGLAAVIRREGADLVLFGKYGVGTDEWQTGPMTGAVLDWPHATGAFSLEIADGTFTVRREIEGAVEIQEGRLPAVITCEKGLNTPRYASLKGIMQAKKKTIEILSPGELGIDDALLDRPSVQWDAIEKPPARSAGKILDGDASQAAAQLAKLLREEAKVI